MKRILRVALAGAVLLLASGFARAEEKRVALVIGNGAYRNASVLRNPPHDSEAIGEALRRLGFLIIGGTDLDKPAMETQLRRFGEAAQEADIAVVFYSGHGMQVAGQNYLLPVSAKLDREKDLKYEAVKVEDVLGEANGAKRLRLVILDACRDNPFSEKLARSLGGTRSAAITRGFARVESSGTDTLIAYATREDSVAQDGNGENSPFTTALLKHIETPDLDVDFLFRRVRDEVRAMTNGAQEPAIYGSLGSEAIYLKRSVTVTNAAPNQFADAWQIELAFWISTEMLNTIGAYETYKRKFPAGHFIEIADLKIKELSAAAPSTSNGPLMLVPGTVFRDCPDCPEMVVIPPGSFMMGSPATEKERDDDEGPQHRVTIGNYFALGKYDVTFAEWDACVTDGGCNGYRPEDEGWGRGDRPVINVSWEDAQTYIIWLNQKVRSIRGTVSAGDGRGIYRLPTEAEWEYAARAGTATARYWGEKVGSGHANCDGCGSKWDFKQTSPVGSFPPNAFGLYDMLGNVGQKTADCWNGNYDGAPDDGRAWTTEHCSDRVLRGSCWGYEPRDVRAAFRLSSLVEYRAWSSGFRVARTISP
jgi:formylglycine-generating enzyme required for sulfatase activity